MNLGLGLIESVIFSAKTLSFINTVGIDVIGKTISATTTSIASIITHFASVDQAGINEFKKVLEEIDLEFKIGVLEELVKEQKGDAPISVKKALMGVNDILVKIEVELKTIKKAFEGHQQKYFRGWRTFDCSCNIDTIKRHSELLESRSDELKDLLKIYGNKVENQKETNNNDKNVKTTKLVIEDLS